MKRFFLFFMVLFCSTIISYAKQVGEQTAKIVAYNYYRSITKIQDIQALQLAYTASSVYNSATVNEFYIFNVGTQGFIIVAADDIIKPVLGYSTETIYDPGIRNDNFSYWIAGYQEHIFVGIENDLQPSPAVLKQWDALRKDKAPDLSTARTTAVSPLMTTKWNEFPYYNDMCPYDAPSSPHALTGCTATAMAQVMKFWNWPPRGDSSHTYTDAHYGTQTANFRATAYQWTKMPDILTTHDTAVATLMYHAGVAVNMIYGTSVSLGYPTQFVFPDYFGYKNTAVYVLRSYPYVGHKWPDLIKADLDAGRPVIYVGYNKGYTIGHTFVADGYDASNNIHFNWGWGGSFDGYFSIDSLVELVPTTPDTFTYHQFVITGIQPDPAKGHLFVENATLAGDIDIYPNPATNDASLVFNLERSCNVQLRVYDMSGRLVYIIPEKQMSNGKHAIKISTSAWLPGMYNVSLVTETGILTKQIAIRK